MFCRYNFLERLTRVSVSGTIETRQKMIAARRAVSLTLATRFS